MRKVLFVHDGPMYKNSEGDIFGIHYNNKIKNRYLSLGDQVTFCMRVQEIEGTDYKKFSKMSTENFNFIPFPNFKNIRSYFKNKPKANNIICQAVLDHDVLVARMPSASGILAIKAARKKGKPYLVEMVACTFDAYWNYNWKGKIIAHYKLWKTQRIIKNCPYVIYVTESYLQKRYPTKGVSIGCSDVEIGELSNSVLNERINKIKNNNNQPLIIGTIGVLDIKYKGQADVIKALSILKADGLLFKYKLVGQGSQDYLQKIIDIYEMNNEVEIIGPLKSNYITNFIQTIDIYIQPSRTEGLPRALVEAMSMACPCLASSVGGILELLSPDSLFEAKNVNQICNQLKKINADTLLKKATSTFSKAINYELPKLEKRRNDFYSLFLKEMIKHHE